MRAVGPSNAAWRTVRTLGPDQIGGVARSAITWLKPGRRLPDALPGAAGTLGRIGSLEVRLAQGKREIKRAQKLRYRVFYEQGSAIADAATLLARRDKDAFDKICDHLMVVDHAAKPTLSGKLPAVGTYRLLRQEVAARYDGFYTEAEFEIAGLMQRHAGLRFLELGRSCVLPPYRTKRTMELLWRGIYAYVHRHRLDVLIGCASFEGTNPDLHAQPLSFLHHFARAPEPWRARAMPSRYVEMNRLPKHVIDPRAALHALPPLIKAYLRLGACIGDGAVVDHQFGTTDVLIVLPISTIQPRYIEHFGGDLAQQRSLSG